MPFDTLSRSAYTAHMSPHTSPPLIVRFQKRLFNPLVKRLVQLGLVRSVALLETTGRKSGLPRRTPVGNGLDKRTGTFWLIAERGHQAAYVRNIEADPHVRVKIGRRWHDGTAQLLDGDDPIARQRSMPRLNAAVVRAVGSELLSIRIDLEPPTQPVA
jgi:deazaflavin-dependent oxidoreductase (nitroreductase family)